MRSRFTRGVLLAVALGCALVIPAVAATFTVNTTADTPAVNAAVSELDASGHVSLRSAIMRANYLAGADTINLQPGAIYTLTRSPSDSGIGQINAATGDLDITGPLTINGNGATVDAGGIDRVFDIQNASLTNFSVTMYSLTITGGHPADAVMAPGGGINLRAATLNLVGCTVTGNNCAPFNGGGIAANSAGFPITVYATLGLFACTVTGNTAGNGGGILCGGCTATIRNSTISGNTSQAGAGGGGVFETDNKSVVYVLNSTVQNGSAALGGALSTFGTGFATLTANRIVGNTATLVGADVYNRTAKVAATDNWWGSNASPAGLISGGSPAVNFNPWLVLGITASPGGVAVGGGTSAITASLIRNSNGADTSSLGFVPDGIPVTFASTLGSISPGVGSTLSGVASATFKAGNTAGTGSASATVDSQTVSLNIPIGPAPVVNFVAVAPSLDAPGDPVGVTVDASGGAGVVSVTANGQSLTNTSGTLWQGTIPAVAALGSHTVTVVATDHLGITGTDSSESYITTRILGITGRSLTDSILSAAASHYLFAVWGRATVLDANTFLVTDATGRQVKVLASGSPVVNGGLVWARGTLNASTTPPTMTSSSAWVNVLAGP